MRLRGDLGVILSLIRDIALGDGAAFDLAGAEQLAVLRRGSG